MEKHIKKEKPLFRKGTVVAILSKPQLALIGVVTRPAKKRNEWEIRWGNPERTTIFRDRGIYRLFDLHEKEQNLSLEEIFEKYPKRIISKLSEGISTGRWIIRRLMIRIGDLKTDVEIAQGRS